MVRRFNKPTLGLVACLALSGCAGLDYSSLQSIGSQVLGAVQSTSLSAEQEHYLGRSVAAMILSKYPPSKNNALVQYVNKVGRTVASYSDMPETFGGYHFMVLDTPEINAFSTPGGFVFLTQGFVSIMPGEDALAAVLAHEVAHVVKGHGTAAVSNSNITKAALSVGKEVASSQGGSAVQVVNAAFGDSVSEVFETVFTKGYSRGQEYDADKYASELLMRAGYNPSALVEMLDALGTASKAKSEGGLFSTHPAAEDRKEEVKDVVAKSTVDASAVALRTKRFKAVVRS